MNGAAECAANGVMHCATTNATNSAVKNTMNGAAECAANGVIHFATTGATNSAAQKTHLKAPKDRFLENNPPFL